MAAAAYSTAVLADSPRLYWKLQDASGAAVDSSGAARDANATAGVITYRANGMTEMGDRSMSFAGGSYQQQVPHLLGSFSDNFAFELIIKCNTAAPTNKTLMAYGSANFNGFWLMTDASRKVFVIAQNRFLLAAMANPLSTTLFSHVVIARDAGTWKYYYNGAVDTANAGANNFDPGATDTPLSIGAIDASFSVDIEHFAVYTTAALSAARVAAHYAAAIAPEASAGVQLGGDAGGWWWV